MAKVNQKTKEMERQQNVEATVSKTEQFYNENKKAIWGVIIAALVIGLGVLAYSKYVYQPKCAEAMEHMFPAELSFQKGEYDLALNGDGNVDGFVQVIDEYGAKAGKVVYFYAGVCELQLGNFDDAITYLKKYDGKDVILAARAESCKGDAYVGLEDYGSAAKCFMNAAAKNGVNALGAGYLVKAGLAYEKLGENAKAFDCYKTIKEDYPQSVEAYDIDRYIQRVAE